MENSWSHLKYGNLFRQEISNYRTTAGVNSLFVATILKASSTMPPTPHKLHGKRASLSPS